MSTSNIPPGHQTPQVQPQSEQARQNKQPKISGQEPNSTGQSGTIASKDKTARTEDFAQQQIRQEQKEDQKEREERQRQDLEELKAATNEFLAQFNVQIDFTKDHDYETLVCQVKELQTEEVIRQIPPEVMLRVARNIEEMSGILLDEWS